MCCVLCISSSWDPPLYSGEGCTLTPPTRPQEAASKEEEKGGGGQWWGQACPLEILTLAGLGQGYGIPFFSSFPNGLLSVNWPIR
jgi:hypothetical protein